MGPEEFKQVEAEESHQATMKHKRVETSHKKAKEPSKPSSEALREGPTEGTCQPTTKCSKATSSKVEPSPRTRQNDHGDTSVLSIAEPNHKKEKSREDRYKDRFFVHFSNCRLIKRRIRKRGRWSSLGSYTDPTLEYSSESPCY